MKVVRLLVLTLVAGLAAGQAALAEGYLATGATELPDLVLGTDDTGCGAVIKFIVK